MSNNPTLSIVLPCYNGSKYLRQSIDSILAQGFKDWELILVDDCSKDETPAIMNSYLSDPRISYIRNQTNQKIPKSLNAGFNLARGKYHTWTSDDNVFKPDAFLEMIKFLKENPSVDIVCANYDAIGEVGEFLLENKVSNLDKLYMKCNIGACFMYKAEVYKKVGGYRNEYFCAEDYDFWLLCYEKGFKFAVLDKNLYQYRMHSGNLTTTQNRKMIETTERIIFEHLERNKTLTNQQRARTYLRLFNKNDYELKWNFLKKAVVADLFYSLTHLPKIIGKIISFLVTHSLHFKKKIVDSWRN